MTLTRIQARLLLALFDLAQENRAANVKRLADRLEVRLGVVASELDRLDALGLVVAARVRLSLPGLVVAAQVRSRLERADVAQVLAA